MTNPWDKEELVNLGIRLAGAEQECAWLRAELEQLGKDKASNDADYLQLSRDYMLAEKIIASAAEDRGLSVEEFRQLHAPEK